MKKSFTEKLALVLFIASLYSATAGVFYLAATRSYQPIASFDVIRLVMFVLLFPLLTKYVLQLVCSPLYSLVGAFRKQSDMTVWTPSVSVLIPAWNEEVGIVKTIKSVLDTQYPRLQIVVINDGSTDGTHEKVTGFMADHKPEERQGARLEYLNVSNGGKARALNRAFLETDGEIIITIDADSIMDPAAITNFVKRFNHPGVGAVAGNVIVGNRRKPIEWMQQMEYLSGFFLKRTDSLFNSVYVIGGAAAAYRREVLQEMGGFDHRIITEDVEMSTRILSRGYKTRYAADAVVYTEGPSDFKGLCNQRLRWKYGKILTFIKYRKLFFSARPRHNPYLTFLLLPMAVYAECLLLIQAFMLASLFIYTVCTSNYMLLTFIVAMLAAVFSVQVLADSRRRFHRNLVLLAPVTWLVFFAVEMIELQALFRSLKRLVTRQELKWQRWVRKGILNNACIGEPQMGPASLAHRR